MPAPEFGAYCAIDPERELRQGEILSNLTYYVVAPNSNDPETVDTAAGIISYAVIATPDCDLLQDFIDRRDGKVSALFSILMFGMEEAGQAKKRIGYDAKEWKHVVQNEMERFHFLRAIEADGALLTKDIPDAVVDFKRYFTLPADEIYRQCRLPEPNRAYRRYRLSDLWREDLQRRAMSYMQRVGLPNLSDAR